MGDRPIALDLGEAMGNRRISPAAPFLNPNGGKGLPIFAQFPERRPMV